MGIEVVRGRFRSRLQTVRTEARGRAITTIAGED